MANWGSWTGTKPYGPSASGSGTVTGSGYVGYQPSGPSADQLLQFFQGVAGGGGSTYSGLNSRGGGGYGGGGGGGFAAPQQIDPLDLQAWDAQLALNRRATDLAIAQQPQQWRDTLKRLQIQTKANQQNWATTRGQIGLGRKTANREYGVNLGNLHSDATARGAFTSLGTQQGETNLGSILSEQMKDLLLKERQGRWDYQNNLSNIKLDRREAARQNQQNLLNIDTMKNQLWFDALARNQVQGQIGGAAIPYINVPASAGKVIHFGGIGMNF